MRLHALFVFAIFEFSMLRRSRASNPICCVCECARVNIIQITIYIFYSNFTQQRQIFLLFILLRHLFCIQYYVALPVKCVWIVDCVFSKSHVFVVVAVVISRRIKIDCFHLLF